MLNSKSFASFTLQMFQNVPSVAETVISLNSSLVEEITVDRLFELYQVTEFNPPNLAVNTTKNCLTLDFKGQTLELSKKAKLSPQAISTNTVGENTSYSGDIWIGAKGKGFLLNAWYSLAGAEADLTDVLVPALRSNKASEVIPFLAISLRKVDQPGVYKVTDCKTANTPYGGKSGVFSTNTGDVRVSLSPAFNIGGEPVYVDDYANYQSDPLSIVGLTGVSIPNGFNDINKEVEKLPVGSQVKVLAVSNRLTGLYGAEAYGLLQTKIGDVWAKIPEKIAYYWLSCAHSSLTDTQMTTPDVTIEVIGMKVTKKGNTITDYKVIHD